MASGSGNELRAGALQQVGQLRDQGCVRTNARRTIAPWRCAVATARSTRLPVVLCTPAFGIVLFTHELQFGPAALGLFSR